jgi:hypothetical protein
MVVKVVTVGLLIFLAHLSIMVVVVVVDLQVKKPQVDLVAGEMDRQVLRTLVTTDNPQRVVVAVEVIKQRVLPVQLVVMGVPVLSSFDIQLVVSLPRAVRSPQAVSIPFTLSLHLVGLR